jgi:pentatricopeptide repeat protein
MLASSYNYSAQIAGLMGDFSKAVEKGLRALEYLDKANSTLYLASIYYTLVVNYVKLGDLSNAEEYFDKMENLPTELKNHLTLYYTNLAKIVYYAGKNQWEKSTKHFNELASKFVNRKSGTFNFSAQENYAWTLEKQGKSAEAKKLRKDINNIVEGYSERVKHAHVELGLIAPINVIAGKNFEARLDIVNISRANCTITKIEHLVPSGLDVVAIPSKCIADEGLIKLKDKNIGPFKVTTVTVSLQASKAGTFTLNPKVTYVDDLGQTKESLTEAITVTAKPEKPKYKVLPGRIPTGNTELDSLLLGGIPEKYAVVLTGSPSDERDKLIKNFLKAATENEIIFYITTEASDLEDLLENPNFYLFLCNPKPKIEFPDLPNVFVLQSKTDITNLGIALTKAIRSIDKSVTNKRICIEILSDILVKHGINTTREWISGLITDLGAKGFTMLAVINPRMHSLENLYAVLDLFDGEISIIQSDDPLDCKKSIHVKKLRNQDYIKNPICLR